MMRPQPHEAFDPDLEAVDNCGLVESSADLRERDRHGRLWAEARRCSSAANALPVTLLARPARSGRMFGERHRFSESRKGKNRRSDACV